MARQAVAGPVARRIRDHTWRLLQETGALARWYAPLLAGWSTRCPDPLPGLDRQRAGARSPWPRPGTRSPQWMLKPERELAGRFQLVTFDEAGELARQAADLAARLPGLVAHFPLGGRRVGFVLIRPDGYIAASGATPRFPAVAEAITRLAA
jgi:hypothetical protein